MDNECICGHNEDEHEMEKFITACTVEGCDCLCYEEYTPEGIDKGKMFDEDQVTEFEDK
jgi:hypothetical protein